MRCAVKCNLKRTWVSVVNLTSLTTEISNTAAVCADIACLCFVVRTGSKHYSSVFDWANIIMLFNSGV